jgi:hypothetical protein
LPERIHRDRCALYYRHVISEDTLAQIEAELAKARQAQAEGNHGMARVCARRAAGAALAARTGRRSRSALDRLRALAADSLFPAEVRRAAARLTTRLAPDHTLPFDDDPLDDARRIIEHIQSQ